MRRPVSTYTDALRPDATVVARAAAARKDGYASARADAPPDNPFRGDAGSAIERVCAVMWIRGYTAGNPLKEA